MARTTLTDRASDGVRVCSADGSWRFGQGLGHQAEQGLGARREKSRRPGEVEKCHFRHQRSSATRVTGDAAATMADAARQGALRRRGHRGRNFRPAYGGRAPRSVLPAGPRCHGGSRNRRGMRMMCMTGMGIGRGRRETAGDQKHRPKRPQQMNFPAHVEPYHDGSGSTNVVATIGKSTNRARR